MPESFIAVGVGNSSVQFGRFFLDGNQGMPTPVSRKVFPSRRDDGTANNQWECLKSLARPANQNGDSVQHWCIASVFEESADAIAKWVQEHAPESTIQVLKNDDFPISIQTDAPDRVGTDRIAAAVAVARTKSDGHPAIFVDAGTALTVNVISTAGDFLGGAILPGTTTSGTALNKSTDQLPRIVVTADKPAPQPIGTATNAAIASGIYWGAVGATKELIERMTSELAKRGEKNTPEIYVTGGFGPALAKCLGDKAEFVPHLVLAGIAIAVQSAEQVSRGR